MKKCALVVFILQLLACADNAEPPVNVVTEGEVLFKANCKVCHAQGINGAPILGNAAMWAGRKDQGLAVLVEHASNGYGLMPAKGGNTALTQEEITQAVEFMLSKLEEQ